MRIEKEPLLDSEATILGLQKKMNFLFVLSTTLIFVVTIVIVSTGTIVRVPTSNKQHEQERLVCEMQSKKRLDQLLQNGIRKNIDLINQGKYFTHKC